MSPALPKRTIQELREFVELHGNAIEHKRWLPQIDRALKGSPKRRAFRASQKKAKRSKRETKAMETAVIRAAVAERSFGRCEVLNGEHPDRCYGGGEELDHFFGRRHGQSVSTCWLICSVHHRAKTRNNPSAAWWLESFAQHCRLHKYYDSMHRALSRRAFVEARKGAA